MAQEASIPKIAQPIRANLPVFNSGTEKEAAVDKLITSAKAAKLIGVTRDCVNKWIRARVLDAHKPITSKTSKYLLLLSEVEAFRKKNTSLPIDVVKRGKLLKKYNKTSLNGDIRRGRETAGLSVWEVARLARCSVSQVNVAESDHWGDGNVSIPLLKRICAAVGCRLACAALSIEPPDAFRLPRTRGKAKSLN